MERERRVVHRIAWTSGALLLATAGLLLATPFAAAQGMHASAAIHANGSAVKAKVSCATGINPEFYAFDPITNLAYVSNPSSGSVSVFKGSCTLAHTIALPSGADPRGVAYSSATNRIYVADFALNQLYIISKFTIKQTLTSPSFDAPYMVAYDPSAGYFYGGGSIAITNFANDTVSFVSQPSATGTAFVFYVVATGASPAGVCYSPTYSAVMVVNEGSDNVTTFDATTLTLITSSIPVGSVPFECAYDPATLLTYVTNTGSANVSVITAYYDAASIPVGNGPYGIAFDPANLEMYVTNFYSHNVSTISSASTTGHMKLPVGDEPVGVGYDSSNHAMYALIWNTATMVKL